MVKSPGANVQFTRDIEYHPQDPIGLFDNNAAHVLI